MFDFLFKRNSDQSPETPAGGPAAVAEQGAAAALSASRRVEQSARAAALNGDEAAAVELILHSEFAGVRLTAAEHVRSPAQLEQVLQAMRNTDRRVAKLMQGRLDAIRYQLAEQQKAQACLDQAQRMLQDDKLMPNQVAELDRQWLITSPAPGSTDAYDAARAALAARLEAQVRLQRSVIDTMAELRQLPAAGFSAQQATEALARFSAAQQDYLVDPEQHALPRHMLGEYAQALEQGRVAVAALEQHQAGFDARQAALAGWQAQDAAALDGAQLRRDWQALPKVPDGPLAARQQADFDALLATVPQPAPAPAPASAPAVADAAAAVQQQAGNNGAPSDRGGKPDPKDQRDGKRARAAQPAREVDKQFTDTMDALEAALEQGALHMAAEHDKWLKDNKAGRLSSAQSDRLAHLRAELKRLGDWARWGGNVSREELVKAVEELPAQGLAMAELAKKVGSMRERWKALDAVSGHAPKTLWERFDAACTTAYAPAAAHFKQLADERHHNAAKAQALIDETLALAGSTGADAAAGEHADWKNLAAAGQRLRQVWERLGTIDRKDKRKLDQAFDKALAQMLAPLAEQRKLEVAKREQLIAEAEQLQTGEQRNTLDQLRRLQERWQEGAKALPLERKIEQALWQRFRAVCDAVFAKRKEDAHAADHERRAHLHAREALCAQLEGFDPSGEDKAQLSAIAQVLRDVASAWHASGAVPRASETKITQRYQDAVARVQGLADAIRRRAGAAQANALRDKLRLTQALEAALVAGDDIDSAEWDARWKALPPLSAEYERALQQRFQAALAASTTADKRAAYAALLERNRATLLDEVLRQEIVAGVDSGAEFARERLKMQVQVLQSSLKSGQKAPTQVAQYVQLCAMPALADARTASRIEQLFRRIGGQ